MPSRGFPGGTVNTGDPDLIPGVGRAAGEGNGNPLQNSCLENPMDRVAWWATVYSITGVRHNLANKLPPCPPATFSSHCQPDRIPQLRFISPVIPRGSWETVTTKKFLWNIHSATDPSEASALIAEGTRLCSIMRSVLQWGGAVKCKLLVYFNIYFMRLIAEHSGKCKDV